MISIMLNGKKIILEMNTTLKDALKELENHMTPFAVAVNRNFVPRHDYPNILLKEGDEIETITPMQGG